jgi:hypothetical protein
MNAITANFRIRGLGAVIILSLILISFSERPSDAAEISCLRVWGTSLEHMPTDWYPSGRRPNPNTCELALIEGDLETGDSVRFAGLLRRNHPFLDGVWLWSSGGLVEEAIKIGRMIRKELLVTHAPDRNEG